MPVVMSRPTPGLEEPKPLEQQPQGQVLVNTIMRRYGMCEPNITGPHYFKQAVTAWWDTVKDIAGNLWWTTQATYNPIENYDRFEDRKYHDDDVKKENDTRNIDETVRGTEGIDQTVDETLHQDGSTETKVSAFDNSDYQPKEMLLTETNGKNTTHTTANNTSSNITEHENVNNYTTDNDFDHDEHARMHGNIGVTTTQQMLQAEREVVNYNWYEVIARMFADEFLILVW